MLDKQKEMEKVKRAGNKVECSHRNNQKYLYFRFANFTQKISKTLFLLNSSYLFTMQSLKMQKTTIA